jgi:hypothetical protein
MILSGTMMVLTTTTPTMTPLSPPSPGKLSYFSIHSPVERGMERKVLVTGPLSPDLRSYGRFSAMTVDTYGKLLDMVYLGKEPLQGRAYLPLIGEHLHIPRRRRTTINSYHMGKPYVMPVTRLSGHIRLHEAQETLYTRVGWFPSLKLVYVVPRLARGVPAFGRAEARGRGAGRLGLVPEAGLDRGALPRQLPRLRRLAQEPSRG